MLNHDQDNWLNGLNEEDRAFIRRFLLASGSLKELATVYGISYPTVRIRLDRLIEKIRIHDDASSRSAFERTARLLFADGKLDAETLKTILGAHRKELDPKSHE